MDEILNQFETQGYYVLENLLTAEEVSACESEIDRLHHLGAGYKEQGDARGKHFQLEPYAKSEDQDGLPVLRKIEQTREFSEVFKDLSRHPKLLTVVRKLLGEDLLLFRSTLMLKPAHHGSAHSFHQDSAYWPMRPPALVTVSIALTDSTPENGCIQVIPRSHEWGMQEWGAITQESGVLSNRPDLDTSEVFEVPLKAGSALMFHSLVVHGSGPNRSPRPRHTALYAYFPPTVRYTSQDASAGVRTFPVVAGLEGREEMTLTAEERVSE